MKNILQFLLLASLTGTLCAADSTATGAGAAAVADSAGVKPTYDSELAALRDELEHSVSPDSRPYIYAMRRLELDAKHYDIAAAEAVEAVHKTLKSEASCHTYTPVDILGTDLAKKILLEKNIASIVTYTDISYGHALPCIGDSTHIDEKVYSKYCLTPNACRSLLAYVTPKATATKESTEAKNLRLEAGIERWHPKPVAVVATAPRASERSGSPNKPVAIVATAPRASERSGSPKLFGYIKYK